MLVFLISVPFQSLMLPVVPPFKDKQARHSCCVMLFTTMDTPRYMSALLC